MSDALRPAARYDVAVIGAGPAGTTTAALLEASGLDVAIFERSRFPRFSIGESLLPVCNDVLREAKLFELVEAQGYQVKSGAVFVRGDERCEFDFGRQFGGGETWTWQVPRADFDNVLAEGVRARGVPIFFEHGVSEVRLGDAPTLRIEATDGARGEVRARFIVDASGFGRTLPRLLDLEKPSTQPVRQALFTHVRGDRRPEGPNAGRIFVMIHQQDVWIWIIPFSDGRASVGVVAPPAWFAALPEDPGARLQAAIAADPATRARLESAEMLFEPRSMVGYSAVAKQVFGEGYCLVGNATEFLDPVLSSGVALALSSASLASRAIVRHLAGERVDWQRDYADTMARGVDTFRTFVNAWYDGTFHEICFARPENEQFKAMICAALAGYVWDLENPFVREHRRKLQQLLRIVRSGAAGAS
jgi:flavin-dependent dehydrogenase